MVTVYSLAKGSVCHRAEWGQLLAGVLGWKNGVEADEWDIFLAPNMALGPLSKVKGAKYPPPAKSFHNWRVIDAPPGFTGPWHSHLPHFTLSHMSRRLGRRRRGLGVRMAAWWEWGSQWESTPTRAGEVLLPALPNEIGRALTKWLGRIEGNCKEGHYYWSALCLLEWGKFGDEEWEWQRCGLHSCCLVFWISSLQQVKWSLLKMAGLEPSRWYPVLGTTPVPTPEGSLLVEEL